MKRVFLTLVGVMIFFKVALAVIPSYIPQTGLIGWWSFTGNSNDESVSGNNAYYNSATLTTDRFGVANSAYYFNGVSSYIELFSASVPSNIGNGTSISFWFKASTESDNTKRHYILCKYNASGVQVELTNESIGGITGCLRTSLRENAAMLPEANIYSPSRYDDDNWHLGVLTWQSPFMMQYVDGKLISYMISVNSYFDAPGEAIKIGCLKSDWLNPARYFFQGKIDDIGLWNRALTPEEVLSVFNSGATTAVRSIDRRGNLKMYLNSSKENLIVDCTEIPSIDGYKVVILNSAGQSISQFPIVSRVTNISLSHKLLNKFFIVQIINSNEKLIETKKIVF